MPAENGLRLDDQEGRTPLTPDFGKPDPEEAIAKAQLRSRMAALIDGQLLSESKILQSQTLTVSECVGEYIKASKAWIIKPAVSGVKREVQCLLKIGILAKDRLSRGP
jgi:hypothetical protein